MMTALKLVAALMLIPTIVGLQTAQAQPVMRNVAQMYATVAGDLSAAVKLMPDESYGYRPTPAVRSFGQIVAHLAGAQFLYCMRVKGDPFDRDVAAKLGPMRKYSEAPADAPDPKPPSKSALVALLDEGIAYCTTVYATTTDAAAAESVTMGGLEMMRGRSLLENVAHNNEHYGNLVTYLRMNGLIPPSTDRRAASKD